MRKTAALLAAGALVLLPSLASAAEEPDRTGFDVTSAQLRWGMSNEANNRAFAPGTFNLLSAGRVADPGSGGNTLAAGGATWSNGRAAGWKASSGAVSVEKFDGTSYRPATWGGLSTDSAGRPLGTPLAGTFSNHQLVFDGGTGTVDAATGTATVRWKGDATVLFYSGMTFFRLSDPELVVQDGVGTIRATLDGFGSSQDDPGAWRPLPSTVVTLADLGPVDLSLTDGFTITPRYLGVSVTGVGQSTSSPYFGSFPQSFIDFQSAAGSAGFWHSSGGSADEFKQALPMTVSYDAANAVTPPAPAPSLRPDPVTVKNPVKKPPRRSAAPSPASPATSSTNPPTAAPLSGAAPILPALPLAGGPAFTQVAPPLTTTASAVPSAPPGSPDGPWWWLGAALMTLAGSSVAGTLAYSSAARRSSFPTSPTTALP